MTIRQLEHVLVLCDNVDRTAAFYRDALGLRIGDRPPLAFDGHWLYAEDVACLHIADRASYRHHAATLGLEVAPAAGPGAGSIVDHIAFAADDYAAVTDRLARAGVHPVRNDVPGGGPRQLFFDDPEGLRVEVNVTP